MGQATGSPGWGALAAVALPLKVAGIPSGVQGLYDLKGGGHKPEAVAHKVHEGHPPIKGVSLRWYCRPFSPDNYYSAHLPATIKTAGAKTQDFGCSMQSHWHEQTWTAAQSLCREVKGSNNCCTLCALTCFQVFEIFTQGSMQMDSFIAMGSPCSCQQPL